MKHKSRPPDTILIRTCRISPIRSKNNSNLENVYDYVGIIDYFYTVRLICIGYTVCSICCLLLMVDGVYLLIWINL